MFNELAIKIEEHLRRGSNFAIAQVIDRTAPSSGKVGDKALILESGELIGWIGGGCVRGIVIKEALGVIRTKRYRRIRISPEGGTRETANYKEYVMSCQSKGTVEVLIEAVIPQPEVLIVGKSNIARKLAALASEADFRVTVMGRDADAQMFPMAHKVLDQVDFTHFGDGANRYILVATQGEEDDQSVLRALQTSAPYVGFVASSKKAADLKPFLIREGVAESRVQQLRSPAGLDINAKLASEVAISILAEIISHFRTGRTAEVKNKEEEPEPRGPAGSSPGDKFAEEYYINPVCQVPVSRKNPKHVIEYKGEKVYFCCDGCKVAFEQNPAQYIK
ncbi:MAG: XdhC family protein [Flavobacteriaceae bacterium]|jgi:xanthine dehydrogenase accessory factor|nr:MAG: XdhC family protein [Flavobacteriaceae bacterium]